MLSPCKDCEKRELGCHSRCEAYRLYNEENERKRNERLIQSKISDLRMNNIGKAIKRKKV